MRRKTSSIDDLILLVLAKYQELTVKDAHNLIDNLSLDKGVQPSGFYEHVRKLEKENLIYSESKLRKIKKYSLTESGNQRARQLKKYYLNLL